MVVELPCLPGLHCLPGLELDVPHPSQTLGEVNKARKEGCPLVADTRNAEFTGQRAIWQNSQNKEETNKAAQLLCCNQLQLGKRQFWQGEILTTSSWTSDPRNPVTQTRKTKHGHKSAEAARESLTEYRKLIDKRTVVLLLKKKKKAAFFS